MTSKTRYNVIYRYFLSDVINVTEFSDVYEAETYFSQLWEDKEICDVEICRIFSPDRVRSILRQHIKEKRGGEKNGNKGKN